MTVPRAGGACRLALAAAWLALPASAGTPAGVPVEVPSGQPVRLIEVLLDDNPGALWARFRFLAPEIAETGGSVGYDIAGPDMDHLCDAVAIPYLAEYAIEAARVVISLSDRPVEFGASNPDATQFFESYRIENDACIWEEF